MQSGTPWTVAQMQAVINWGPHKFVLAPATIKQLWRGVQEKIRTGQAKKVDWEDIKNDPAVQLKISPIAMIPHKSQKYQTIFDLSFSVHMMICSRVPSIIDASIKTAPCGAIDQIDHSMG